MNSPNPITEADMLAYLRDVTAYYAPAFPELKYFNAGAVQETMQVYLSGTASTGHTMSAGKTFREAADKLRKDLGSNTDNAAKLREQAAKLIAEADKLENAK